MKSVCLAVTLALLSVPWSWARNCNGIVSDEASIFHNTDDIANGAKVLIDQGADVKVVTVNRIATYGNNLLAVEKDYEAECPSWKSPAGARKANLFVLMVAPND